MEPTKPTSEVDRYYRYLELENELCLLLISDATSKTAASAMALGVGSFLDPIELPGLAHFLGTSLLLSRPNIQSAPDDDCRF